MASLYAAPSSIPAQSSTLTTAQAPRTVQPQALSVSAPPFKVPQAQPQPSSTSVQQPASQVQAQPSPVSAAQPASQEARPRPRGLAASRHASGAGPANSGQFKFFVPEPKE
jgi:hypothetical protein